MAIYRDKILPRIIDVAAGTKELAEWRRRCVEGLHGVVVEPGFGSGLNVPWYPPEVERVYAIDPAELGQQLAAKRVDQSDVAVDFIGLDGQDIPLEDDSCDCGLLTLTLCTIPDADKALSELRRVIKPGGRLHFLEHGHAPTGSVATWQRRMEPVQKRVFDGCHLTRKMPELIAGAGFTIDWVDASYAKGPKPLSYFYVGVATNP
ncbi:MAG: class I SAM-dependent methyltransferase [Actinomycetota bacterium]